MRIILDNQLSVRPDNTGGDAVVAQISHLADVAEGVGRLQGGGSERSGRSAVGKRQERSGRV